MIQCKAEVLWLRGDQPFTDNRYSRKHVLRFDGGAEIPGSSSPHVVPVPMSDATAVDNLPTRAWIDAMHHAAHGKCFIAHSVKTVVQCRPVY